jgi:hypothetical protein
MSFWDKQFAVTDFEYGTFPNAFPLEQSAQLKRCREVLPPVDGESRNSVWLAEQGHLVTAAESSSAGLTKGQAYAVQRGVSVKTVHADLEHCVPDLDAYDAIVFW